MEKTKGFFSRGFWSEFFSREVWSVKNIMLDILSCIAFLSGLILFYIISEILQAWFSKPISRAIALTILIPYYFVARYIEPHTRRISFKNYVLLVIVAIIATVLFVR